jgi:membrane-bound serine protease (ClpP class)
LGKDAVRTPAKTISLALLALATLGAGRASFDPPKQAAPLPVALVELDGSVNPGSADYLVRAIQTAEEAGVAAVVIRLDTPGGMLESTREIVKAQLAARVPVVVWVGPSGARAGSAGVFITVAAHVAAMAPATNIGAAHPVQAGGGEEPDETMTEKVTNDTAAWAQGIAAQRGRNGEWVADAVRKSVSVHAEQALELGVIDLVSPDLPSLLEAIDGREVKTAAGTIALRTSGARLEPLRPTARERLLDGLGNPNIAFLLLGLGVLGLLAELYHPGTLFPGVLGAVSLALGLLATRMLPVDTAAIVLVFVGAVLVAAEFFVTSWGLLALAGAICLGVGGFLLIDPSEPGFLVDRDFGVQWSLVLPIVLAVAAFAALVVWKVAVSRTGRQLTGALGLVGEVGVAAEEIGPEKGKAFVHGELWEARSARAIAKDAKVKVERVEGLVVTVVETVDSRESRVVSRES